MSKTPEIQVIVNTSPLLYLHQIGLLDLVSSSFARYRLCDRPFKYHVFA
ncbi:MAG: hypothetical protein ACFE0J_07125 [Elainellaceae cyanobacterium]